MTYTDLTNSAEYEEITELSHDDVKKFIVREASGNNGWALIAKMYQGAGLLLFGFLLMKAFIPFMRSQTTENLIGMGWGILVCFTALIVAHELIHYLAYLVVGARKLSFGMKLRKFIFYVQADKQVMNYKQMKIVALAPAVVVALASGIVAMLNFETPIYYFCLTIFAVHSLFCSGDLGLLCFFENRNEDEIVTFDDVEAGVTKFYRKKKDN